MLEGNHPVCNSPRRSRLLRPTRACELVALLRFKMDCYYAVNTDVFPTVRKWASVALAVVPLTAE